MAKVKKEQTQEEPVSDGPTTIAAEAETPSLTLLQSEIERLSEALAEAEAKAAQNLDGWQRAQASFVNYRKRAEAEKNEWQTYANAGLLTRLLPVLDDFNRAFTNIPADNTCQNWLGGIQLVMQKLQRLLEIEGVKPIEIQSGQPFDPYFHEAVQYLEVPDAADGAIIAEMQRGYLLAERVLRPAMVIVAKQPSEPPAASAAATVEAAS